MVKGMRWEAGERKASLPRTRAKQDSAKQRRWQGCHGRLGPRPPAPLPCRVTVKRHLPRP